MRANDRSTAQRKKRAKDLMLTLGLNETIDQLVLANSVCWYGHVLRRALYFEVEGRRKKGKSKQIVEESKKLK